MITTIADRREVAAFCPSCGSEVLVACPVCGYRIKGAHERVAGGYQTPDFCDNCSTPFPWLSRHGRIFQLENMLDREQLDEATRLEIREQLEALAEPEVGVAEQRSRWTKIKEGAPTLWANDAALRIIETLVTAEAKKHLGLGA